jgi:hypothetical protein
MEVAPMSRLKRLAKSTTLALCSLPLAVSIALANPAPPLTSGNGPIPMPVRPFTYLKNLETQYRYIPSLMNKRAQAEAEAARKITGVMSGAEPKYDRGADISEIITNTLHDWQVIFGDFFNCLNPSIVGICWKIDWSGFHLQWYRRYRLPMQNIELVQTPFKSGYMPKFVQSALLPIVEQTYYPLADDIATTSLQWTNASAQLQGAIIGTDFASPAGSMSGDGSVANKVKGGIERKKRFRNMDDYLGGTRFVEYTVFPQLFPHVFSPIVNVFLSLVGGTCNDWLGPGVWSSYYPATIMPARMSALSFFLFPAEMINKFLIPNTCAGVNNALRGGKSPADMLITGNLPYDALNLMSPGVGCLKQNDNNWVPVTNYATNSSFSVGSVQGVVKGQRTARMMMPGMFYGFDLERDRVQWSQNNRMPKNCGKLEKFVRDFGDANMRKGDDPWNVAILWREFTCCDYGYHEIGPHPRIHQ